MIYIILFLSVIRYPDILYRGLKLIKKKAHDVQVMCSNFHVTQFYLVSRAGEMMIDQE